MRALLVCPGRGAYQKPQLGSLPTDSAVLDQLDAYRRSLGRPTLREMDQAERYTSRLHVAGEHASILTFGATLADVEALDPDKVELCCVTGNSMGWYTALYAAGALSLDDAARLVETMGSYQADNAIGGQVLYPVSDGDWRHDPALQRAVDAALEADDVHLSIRLGGTAVLAGSDAAVRRFLKELPALKRGARTFPMQLPLHSAFHTPLMEPASERALEDLADLAFQAPTIPMVDGEGRPVRAWSDPDLVHEWTLTTQVTSTYDLTAAVTAALGDYAPDTILLPGPGNSLGGAIAQILIGASWRGLRDRQDFLDAQETERPPVISMAWPDQRAKVAR